MPGGICISPAFSQTDPLILARKLNQQPSFLDTHIHSTFDFLQSLSWLCRIPDCGIRPDIEANRVDAQGSSRTVF
jgi:hypothetical protein